MSKQLAGVMAIYSDAESLIQATEKVRDAKYPHFDAYTPYPVHGLDAAQGLKRSPLPFVTLAAGITGCSLGFLLQYWTSVVDWPLNVGGKPMNSWPAFVPVMFETTILFAGLATVAGMFILNRLPNHHRKAFDPRLTCDRFALVIEATGKKGEKSQTGGEPFREAEAQEFLKKTGAKEVRSVYIEEWF
jgi:hypothetical protein